MRAMSKENLPEKLLKRHEAELALDNPAVFDAEDSLLADAPSPAQSAVVYLPKSKALIDMTLALVSGKVAEGGTIVLAGANDAGIRSAKDAYEANIGPVDQKIVGNHSALYVGKNARRGADKKVEDFLSSAPLRYEGPAGTAEIEVAVLPGVFSAGKLDAGTKALLDALPYRAARVLDVGCGAGVIGSIYKKLAPESEVDMVDSSPLAVIAAKKTVEKSGVDGSVAQSDVFSSVSGQFDLILSNPPFHQGVDTDYSFIDRFAAGAKAHLAPHGEVWVVANSFLPYQPILERGIGPTEVVSDDKRFKVYRSRRA